MSKSITIQEDGVAQNLSLDVLRVPKKDGGTEDWVPEDGKNLVNIRVKQNGTYNASDFGAYGIAEVKVACTAAGGSATSSAASKTLNNQSNPAIKEGDKARTFTAQRLETLLQGGGSCKWVQKDAVGLGTKNINVDNKTYKAEDDGKYGYSEVVVSGISITTSTDDDGNEVVEHTDGTGTETQIVPSSIALEPAPSFTGPYSDGANISFDGMVVKAYKGDGHLWTNGSHPNGIIPFDELILPVTHASASGEQTYYTSNGSLSGAQIRSVAISLYTEIGRMEEDINEKTTVNPVNTSIQIAIVNGTYIVAADHDFTIWFGYASLDGGGSRGTSPGTHSFEYDNKKVYFATLGFPYHAIWENNHDIIPVQVYTGQASNAQIAWEMIFDSEGQGGQEIPVQWMRPGDNEVLETSFIITLGNGTDFGGATGGGGQAGETGAGRND